ncbi:MAG: 60S ribosomal protein L8B [Stictis urceolatum]|nr:60S ribosomal protein L8B [Stictis urceolata]
MGAPFAIVKSKARLGILVHQRTAAAVAINEVRSEDSAELSKLIDVIRSYTQEHEEQARKWGGGILGTKAQDRIEKKQKALNSAIKI